MTWVGSIDGYGARFPNRASRTDPVGAAEGPMMWEIIGSSAVMEEGNAMMPVVFWGTQSSVRELAALVLHLNPLRKPVPMAVPLEPVEACKP